MNIVALTDIHGAYESGLKIVERESPDVLIIGGDLTTVGTVKEAEEAVRRFQQLAATVLCVAGNMDLPQHDDLFLRLGVSINGCGFIHDDVGFFGVSAAPVSPLHTPYELSEEEISRRIRTGYADVRACGRTIFVPHAPPYGTKVDIIRSGIHVGSTAVRDFIDDAQPDVVVCGHIHEARGQDIIGKTAIINCGPALNGCYGLILMSPDPQIMSKTY